MPNQFDSGDHADEFVDSFFVDVSVLEAFTRLNQLQNNVLREENRIFAFLHDQTSFHNRGICSFESAIVGQSSSVLKKGEELIIEAGVGNFNTSGSPKVTIGGKLIPLESGVAEYKFRTAKAPGKYSVPVQIEFLDQEGKTQMVNKTITYRVVE